MKSNKHKATLILGIFTLGFLISYPFSKDSFFIGLFSAICAASMIGGLADWFAVTAIFRSPLGIYWPRRIFRTEIIPRNREGIINGLVDIVENDLLSKESVKKKIMDVNLYELLIQYIEEKTKNGQENDMLERLLEQVYASLAPEDVQALAIAAADSGKRKIDLYNFLVNAMKAALDRGFDRGLVDVVVEFAVGFMRNSKTHNFFTKFVEGIIAEYESGSSSRAMTIKMLMNFVLKKTPAGLAGMIEDELVNAIEKLRDEDDPNRVKVRRRIAEFVSGLENNVEMKARFEAWLDRNDELMLQLGDKLAASYEDFKQNNEHLMESEIGRKLCGNLTGQLENAIRSTGKESSSVKLDAFIKELIVSFINKKHGTIGVIVRDRINQFSTEELVALIENVAGDDLQMIRINGSVVGGLVGMLTYLLTFFAR